MRIIAACMAWAFAAAVLGQNDPVAPPFSGPAVIAPGRPDARTNTRLPGPISHRDIVRCGDLLELAAPQRLFLEELHARYLVRVAEVVRAALPQVDELNAEACRLIEPRGVSRALVSATAKFYDRQDAIEAEIVRADNDLFAELESILAEPQRERLPRVRDRRSRQYCCSLTHRVLRASKIDLSALLEESISEAEILAQLEPALEDYERLLTPLTTALEQEMRTQDRILLELLAWRDRDEDDSFLAPEENRRRSLEGLERQIELLSRGVALQQAIAELNAKTLPELLARLPARMSTHIMARYRRTVYPAVYPDHDEGGLAVCELAASCASIDQGQKEALAGICRTYRENYESINAEMERRCDRWQDHFARTRFSLDQHDPYRIAMRELREKRWRLGLSLVREVQAVVPVGTCGEIDDRIGNLRAHIDNAIRESRDPRDRYPGM